MGLQPFNGHEIAIELSAAELIPAYTIVKFNTSDKTKCNLATAGDTALGVVIPSDEEMMPDGNGGIIKRTGYQIGDFPTLYDEGTVYVKLGAIVVAGDKCVPMAGGLGAKLATTTLIDVVSGAFTAWAQSTHTDGTLNTAGNLTITETKAAMNAAIDEILADQAAKDTVIGKYLVGGNIGDIVPVKIK
jgi:hypothetical protein